jgi:hypothetical protein
MNALERLREQAPLPWARPRAELVLLALVAAVALSPVFVPNQQDGSRLCLSRALVAGRLSNDGCFRSTVDRSRYDGHLYSNKAPGMSVLEIAPAEAVRLGSPTHWGQAANLRLWAVHLFASGLPFLLCVFLVGRISEGLAPGYGAPALVAFGLGTLMAPLAVSGFDHVPAACLGFLAFVLAWRRRPLLAGLAAGAALTTEYEAAAILLIVFAYTALQGSHAALRFAAGAVPGVALLAAYDWAAFGAPWHNPLRYSDNAYLAPENSGLLGIQLPNLHDTRHVFFGERGLFVTSPVVIAAGLGLLLLWRRGLRAEALTCAAVTAAFVIAECGYFIPYGGGSPGPRFLVPALPFLALGLGPAFARRPLVTALLTGVSMVAITAVTLTWALAGPYQGSIWGELGRVLTHGGSSPLARAVSKDVLTWGADTTFGAALVAALAAVAFAIAMRPLLRRDQEPVT